MVLKIWGEKERAGVDTFPFLPLFHYSFEMFAYNIIVLLQCSYKLTS